MNDNFAKMPSTSADGFKEIACPRCASLEYETVHQGADYLYKIPGVFFVACCRCCGLVYQNPFPSSEHISSFYPTSYLPHRNNTASASTYQDSAVPSLGMRLVSRGMTLLRRVLLGNWEKGCDLIPKYIPGGKVLEIGCANGARLASLRTLGWQDLQGVELVEQAAQLARDQGLAVTTGRIEDHLSSLENASLDVVVCSMVLEHLANPFEIVCLIADKLKPGGQFLFSTIVCDSLDAKLYGKFFAGYDFPRHLVYFRKRDLQQMLEPHFMEIASFYQNAPIDYVRSSCWRVENGEGTRFDRLVLRFGASRLASWVGLLLAQSGRTCRASFRCRKKMAASKVCHR